MLRVRVARVARTQWLCEQGAPWPSILWHLDNGGQCIDTHYSVYKHTQSSQSLYILAQLTVASAHSDMFIDIMLS
jgi:hypothetical protein